MSGKTQEKSQKYKLTYFDIRGRGEIPRLLFHAAKKEFEDVRIDNEEEWFTKLKYREYIDKITITQITDDL